MKKKEKRNVCWQHMADMFKAIAERAWHRHPDERFGVGAELAVPARLEHDARDASRSRHPGGMVRMRRPFAVLLHDLQMTA